MTEPAKAAAHTPWTDSGVGIDLPDGRSILGVVIETDAGVRRQIVRAVNSHADMLAVLNAARIMLKSRDQRPEEMKLLDAIKSVIARAGSQS